MKGLESKDSEYLFRVTQSSDYTFDYRVSLKSILAPWYIWFPKMKKNLSGIMGNTAYF